MSSGGHNRIKDSVESSKRIDIRFLQKQINLFRKGDELMGKATVSYDMQWTSRGENRGSVTIIYLKNGCVDISYTTTDRYTGAKEKVNEVVELDYVKTNYGDRAYFICPTCYARRTTLCFNGRFKCRKCAGLNYYSSQMNHDRYTKPDKKIETILKKLKHKYNNICDIYHVPRPKRMRDYTYRRLLNELRHWQNMRSMAFSEIMKEFQGRLKKHG